MARNHTAFRCAHAHVAGGGAKTLLSASKADVRGLSSDTFGAVPDGSDFAARISAAINAGDHGAIRTLSAPELVVGTTVEAYRGRDALLESMAEGDDAFERGRRSLRAAGPVR
jgi:hypothetical protein